MLWDDLKVFLAVSRNPKLELVAKVLHLDATTISRRMRRLEQSIGQTLFERTRRGHVLTPEGITLAEKVEAMESIASNLGASDEAAQSISGRVRLGVTEGLGTAFIAPLLKEFVEANPAIEIDLIALSGFVSLPKREADMSILLTRPTQGRLRVRRLIDYTLHLYGAKEYLAERAPIQGLRDLQQHTLIGYMDDLIYSPQLRYFDEVLPGLRSRISSPSIVAQLQLTRSGSGLCILPKFIAAKHQNLTAVLEEEISVTRSFWLAVHQDVSSFGRIKAMSNFISKIVRQESHIFT